MGTSYFTRWPVEIRKCHITDPGTYKIKTIRGMYVTSRRITELDRTASQIFGFRTRTKSNPHALKEVAPTRNFFATHGYSVDEYFANLEELAILRTPRFGVSVGRTPLSRRLFGRYLPPTTTSLYSVIF